MLCKFCLFIISVSQISDKFTNMWRFMADTRMPETMDEAIERVLKSPTDPSDKPFAFIGHLKQYLFV